MNSRSIRKQRRDTGEALRQFLVRQETPTQRAMAAPDPWASDFAVQAQAALAVAVAPLWPIVNNLLPGLPQKAVLQQAWAVAISKPLWAGMLYRAAVQSVADPPPADSSAAQTPATSPQEPHPLLAEAERLRLLTLQRWKSDAMLRVLSRHPDHAIACLLMRGAQEPVQVDPPDFGDHTRLPGSIRLRYRLASLVFQGFKLPRLIEAAAQQKGSSDYQRRVEFARAMRAAAACGLRFRGLRAVEAALLSDKARWLLGALPDLWPTTLTLSLRQRADVRGHIEALATERKRVQDVLQRLMEAVRGRRLALVPGLIAEVREGPIPKALRPTLKTQPWGLDAVFSHPATRADFGPWQPMTAQALAHLNNFSPTPLPPWWAMKAPEVARWLCDPADDAPSEATSPLSGAQLPPQDLAPLQRTWSDAEQADLIRAGLTRCVHDASAAWSLLTLPELVKATQGLHQRGRALLARRLMTMSDPSPWLRLMAAAAPGQPADQTRARELRTFAQQTIDEHWRARWDHTWGRWVVCAAGTPAWCAVREVALERTRLLEDATALLQDRRQPLDAAGLRLAVIQALHDTQQWPKDPDLAVLRWLQLDPAAAPLLAERGPPALLLEVANFRGTPDAVLQMLIEKAPSTPGAQSVRLAAWRALLKRASSAEQLKALALHPPEHGAWSWSSTWANLPGDDLALSLVLVARRSGWRLIELARTLGASVFADALRRASAALAATAPREAGVLELIAALGVDNAPHLMRLSAMARRAAPAGHKLDEAYRQHLLPKKSGGSRVISAPEAGLKRVQRAIVDRLLAPLGQHPAAHGFARGRSIVGNAQVHVGQAVVANADVQECFASVRWPLVLAALRRDLSARFSPVAVSLLCDLCTAHGGLPTGAPTSPALLNRVLLRTDEILSAAAAQRGVRYSRYADDLSFSGEGAAVQMLGVARRTLAQIGLRLDARKTNIHRRGRRQVVTGLVVNEQVSVPRRIRRRLRAAVHRVEQGQAPHWGGHQGEQNQRQEERLALNCDPELLALKGRLSFVRMVHPQEGTKLLERLGAAMPAGHTPAEHTPSEHTPAEHTPAALTLGEAP